MSFVQLHAFCFSFAMIVRQVIDVGGAFPLSAMKAVQMSFLEVERIRAEPLDMDPPDRFEEIEIPAATLVPKITVAPGVTVSEVAAASLAGAPPPEKKSSTPACIVAVSLDVQEKKVASPPPLITPGTE